MTERTIPQNVLKPRYDDGQLCYKRGSYTREINANTGGIGRIVKVDEDYPMDEFAEKYNIPYTSGQCHYCRSWYFIPDDGTVLTKEIIQSLTKYQETYEDGSTNEGESSGTFTDDQPLMSDYLEGEMSVYIGSEYKFTWTYDDEDAYNGETVIESSSTSTFVGESNEFELTVFGPEDVQKNIHYAKTKFTDSSYSDIVGQEDLYIWSKTDEKHAYTNVVLFSEEYSGSSLKESTKIGWYPGYFGGNGFSHNDWNDTVLHIPVMFSLDETTYKYETGVYQPENKIDHFTAHAKYGQKESKVKSIFIYADCHFALVCPSEGIRKHNAREKDEYGSELAYNVVCPCSTEEPTLTSFKCPDVQITCKNESLSLNHSSDLGVHQWIEAFEFPDSAEEGFILFIDRQNNYNIHDLVSAKCEYARFTHYWNIKQWRDWDEPEKVVEDSLRGTLISNQIWFPIFKPWACANLTLICDEGETSRVGIPNFIRKNVKENYIKNSIQYCKIYDIKSSDSESSIDNTIEQYSKTVSPFRVEVYETHGSRKEYDEEAYRNAIEGSDVKKFMGKCRFLKWRDPNDRTNAKALNPDAFEKIHNTVERWNNFSSTKWAIQTNACFGSGIGPGLHRNTSANTVKYPGNVVSGASDMWWAFEACATHTGTTWVHRDDNGDVQNVQAASQSQLLKYGSGKQSYKHITDSVNNFNQNMKSKTFAAIYQFLNRHKEQIRKCLKEKYVEQWDKTINLVLEDLKNDGRKYFCMEDESPLRRGERNENFYASDAYFDTTEKKYRVNEGIIGWLKYRVFDGASDNDFDPMGPDPDSVPSPHLADKSYYILASKSPYLKITNWTNADPLWFAALKAGFQTEEEMIRAYTSSVNFDEDVVEQICAVIGRDSTVWDLLMEIKKVKSNTTWWKIKSLLEISDDIWCDISGMSKELVESVRDFRETKAIIEEAINRLTLHIRNMWRNSECGFVYCGNAVYDPTMGCSGKFAAANTMFMKNPDLDEDKWLTSDDDLEKMAKDSMPEPDPGTPDEYDPPYDLTEQNECLAYTGEDDDVPMDEDEEAEWDGIPREYVYAPQNQTNQGGN